MCTTGLIEIVNITGLSLYRRLQMLGTCGVRALESSSFYQVSGKSEVVPSLIKALFTDCNEQWEWMDGQ